MTITDPSNYGTFSPRKSETARVNRYNPTEPSLFACVIPAPKYVGMVHSRRVSKRAIHRAEVAQRKCQTRGVR